MNSIPAIVALGIVNLFVLVAVALVRRRKSRALEWPTLGLLFDDDVRSACSERSAVSQRARSRRLGLPSAKFAA